MLIKVSELLCLEPLTDFYCSAAYKPKGRREDTAAACAQKGIFSAIHH